MEREPQAGHHAPGGPVPGSTAAERLWSALLTLATPLLPVVGVLRPGIAGAVAARRGVVARMEAWAGEHREPGVPLLWLHGASAGELVGAAPVVERLRGRLRERTPEERGSRQPDRGRGRPPNRGRDRRWGHRRGRVRHGWGLQLVVTHFSPSGEAAAASMAPDLVEVLPPDTLAATRRAMAALRPDALVFAKGDLWPVLTAAAVEAGVPLGLVNGTVRPGSGRLRRAARPLLGAAYGRLVLAGAASEADAERLLRLGVRSGSLRVTGDAALDGALETIRRARNDPDSPAARLRRWRPEGPRLVAGSTWPEDEEVLLGAAAAAAERGLPLVLVLAPHRPEPVALERLERRCRERLGRRPDRWSELARQRADAGREGEDSREPTPHPEPGARSERGSHPDPGACPRPGGRPQPAPPPLLVDRPGLLAELYEAADLAWVGGGYGEEGLHAVVEPAAAGVPVLYGDRIGRRESRQLEAAGGGLALASVRAAEAVVGLLADRERRARMGRAARGCVEAGAGAAEASAALVEELLTEG